MYVIGLRLMFLLVALSWKTQEGSVNKAKKNNAYFLYTHTNRHTLYDNPLIIGKCLNGQSIVKLKVSGTPSKICAPKCNADQHCPSSLITAAKGYNTTYNCFTLING